MITGTVSDTGLRAIAGADIQVIGTDSRLTADAAGRFSILQVPAGEFLIWVRKLGYRPVSNLVHVEQGDTLRLAFTLEPTITDLAPVVVTEKFLSPKMREFDERRRAGFGHFLDQAQIEKLNFVHLEAVLRTFPSVQLAPRPEGGYGIMSARFGACPMQVYIDGIPRGNSTNGLPSPKDVGAIEVYAGPATAPMSFPKGPGGVPDAGDARCGIILIWTRDGGS